MHRQGAFKRDRIHLFLCFSGWRTAGRAIANNVHEFQPFPGCGLELFQVLRQKFKLQPGGFSARSSSVIHKRNLPAPSV